MSLIKCNKVIPIHDGIIVTDMSFDNQVTDTGIIVGSDDGKSEGIKPRWAKVFAIGKDQTSVKIGDWILVEHGRWTRNVKIEDETGNEYEIRRVEPKSIIMKGDTKPSDVYLGKSNKSTTQTFDFSKPMF
jgi:hypothetical protein